MKAVKRSRIFFFPPFFFFFFLFLDFVFVNVTTAGKLIFPWRGRKKKKDERWKSPFFFSFRFSRHDWRVWQRGRRQSTDEISTARCQRGLVDGGLSTAFFPLWGEVGTIYFALRGDGSTGRGERSPSTQVERSQEWWEGKVVVVVCLFQGTRKIWSKMLGEDSSRVARHVLYVVW